MAKIGKHKAAARGDGNDGELAAVVARYHYPLPLHVVRTRLLGAIASPASKMSPVSTAAGLWDGKLPEFETVAAAEAFMQTFIVLLNRLTKHRQRGPPIRLAPVKAKATREGLAPLAGTRREELDGFFVGLFGGDPMVNLPERAQQTREILAELRGLSSGVYAVASDPDKAMPKEEVAAVLGQLRSLSKIAAAEIQATVLACGQARRQQLMQAPSHHLH